jgi:hypothetical protein
MEIELALAALLTERMDIKGQCGFLNMRIMTGNGVPGFIAPLAELGLSRVFPARPLAPLPSAFREALQLARLAAFKVSLGLWCCRRCLFHSFTL